MKKEPVDYSEEETENQKSKFSPKRGRIVVFILLAICVCAGLFWYMNLSYDDYDIREKVKRSGAKSSNYVSFKENLFTYSRDGASYMDFDSEPIWNESFDMESPTVDVNGDFILIYDRDHTGIRVFDKEGLKGEMSTTLPITRAEVSGEGDVAVLMQDDETAYVRLYNVDGKELASGELHADNMGYPMSMDLSADASKLMISLADLGDGSIKSTVCFFDFSKKGDKAKNRITAEFSYADLVVPEVSFLGDEAVAFGDSQLIFYSASKDIKSVRQVHIDDEIRSVFSCDDKAGIITTKDGNEKKDDTVTVYGTNGIEKFNAAVPSGISDVEFMDNGELLICDGSHIRIYTKNGRKKVSLKTDEAVRTVIPWDGQRNYYFITKNTIEKVMLK